MTALPALSLEVQTFTRLGEPFTIARTRWMFGFQRRFVRRCEWLSFMPKIGFLPHTSHTDDIAAHPRKAGRTEIRNWRREPSEASTRPRADRSRRASPSVVWPGCRR